MNTFYSLNFNHETGLKNSYLLEIFTYEGTYVDLTRAVRKGDIYDMADDFLYSFYDIGVGSLFLVMMNNIDALNMNDVYNLIGENFAFTISTGDYHKDKLAELSQNVKELQLENALIEACLDERSASIISKVKELDNDGVISYKSIKENMNSLSVAYNVCVTYSGENIEPIYYFENIGDVLQFDLHQILTNKISIKRCENCGKYFIPKTRSDEIYCDNLTPSGKTCRQMGYENKINKDEILKEYRKIYKTQNARKQRNKANIINIDEKFEKWHIDAKEKLRLCQCSKIDLQTLIYEISKTDWMKD